MHALDVYLGTVQPLPASGRLSGIAKRRSLATHWLGPEGLVGDQQADRKVHGGPEKALHYYPQAHYQALALRFPEQASRLCPGALGENLSGALNESDIRFGDVWQWGEARLQLSQPRQPCWKIDEWMETDGMAAHIARHGLTGWYWRVLQVGQVSAADGLVCVHQGTGPTLQAAMALWEDHRPDPEALRALAQAPGLARRWREKIEQRLRWLDEEQARTASPEPGEKS